MRGMKLSNATGSDYSQVQSKRSKSKANADIKRCDCGTCGVCMTQPRIAEGRYSALPKRQYDGLHHGGPPRASIRQRIAEGRRIKRSGT